MRETRVFRNLTALLFGFFLVPGFCLGGSLSGKVVLVGPAPVSTKFDVTIDQYICGTEKDTANLLLSPRKEIRNAVVWLENPPADAPWPGRNTVVEMDQLGCVFIPRVVLVPAGGTVNFLNSDRLLHNVHATPEHNVSFNRTQPKARTVPVTFSKPEIVRINCELHSWMASWVVVTAHPFYAITGADGQFTFDNLPAGQYKLRVWQESLGIVPVAVTVSDAGTARVTVEMRVR